VPFHKWLDIINEKLKYFYEQRKMEEKKPQELPKKKMHFFKKIFFL